jgi:hypothetical protein
VTKFIMLTFVLISVLGTSACRSVDLGSGDAYYRRDGLLQQPYAKDGGRAIGLVLRDPGLDDIATDFFWWAEPGKILPAADVIMRSKDYIGTIPEWGHISRRPEANKQQLRVSETTSYIVSIEPIVVVIMDHRTYWGDSFGMLTGEYDPQVAWVPQEVAECLEHPVIGTAQEVFLPCAFSYGTRLANAEVLGWYSPDLAIGPEKPVALADGTLVVGPARARFELRKIGDALEVRPVSGE